MLSGAQLRFWVGAFLIATLTIGCGKTQDSSKGADAAEKQAWIQPTSPEQADQLRQRLITGQADH